MRVFVYWNLHRHLWSVKALEGPQRGRVVAHRRALTLEQATGRVSLAGNARVRAEGRKNVHAGIVGHWNENGSGGSWSIVPGAEGTVCVTYNPYKDTTFVVPNEWARPEWRGSRLVSMQALAGGRPVVVAAL